MLVVDDNATNREILESLLRSWGMAPQSAASAADALDLLRAATTCPDLAILDFHMPGQNGVELAREIRSDPALASMRLLMLSSVSMDRSHDRAAGIDATLTKPVRRSLLLDSLATVMAGAGPRRAAPVAHTVAAPPAPAQGDGRPGILVAEDNAVNRMVAVLNLEKRGYRVHVAGDGREAVELLARTPCAAVLMDCQMPRMDGYEATAEIRRREGAERHIPIIAMTAHAMKGDHERCLAAGMEDYLSKPLRAEALDVILARWVPPTDRAAVDGPAAHDLLDRAVIAELRAGIDPQALLAVIDAFEADIVERTSEISGAAHAGDAAALGDAAHALKGASANLGAAHMARLSARLEELARDGDLRQAPALADQLTRAVRVTPPALRAELSR